MYQDHNPLILAGRGDDVPLGQAVESQVNYLIRADKIVETYLAGLGDAVTELKTPKATYHFQKIQELFESEFPTYQFGYLIQYGVYGLVNSKLNRQ